MYRLQECLPGLRALTWKWRLPQSCSQRGKPSICLVNFSKLNQGAFHIAERRYLENHYISSLPLNQLDTLHMCYANSQCLLAVTQAVQV